MVSFRGWLREKERIEAEQINEMAPSYTPKETGLNEYIWISAKMASHGPRIKVYESNPPSKNFSVSIEDEPKVVAGDCFVNNKELKRIFEFIKINKINLIKYWEFGLNKGEFAKNMIKVK